MTGVSHEEEGEGEERVPSTGGSGDQGKNIERDISEGTLKR